MTEEQLKETNDVLNYMGLENVQDIVIIKKGATAKSILKSIFPKIEWGKERIESKCIFGYKNKDDVDRKLPIIGVNLDLWNTPYRKVKNESID